MAEGQNSRELARQLTGKQLAWAEAYLQHYNATRAAREAKYKGSESVLGSVGSENLRKPKIMAYLRARFEESIMAPEEILARLGAMGRGERATKIREVATKDGIMPVSEWDARAALVDLGKHYALFVDRIAVEDWRQQAAEEGYTQSEINEIFEQLVNDAYQGLMDAGGSSGGDAGGSDQGEA